MAHQKANEFTADKVMEVDIKVGVTDKYTDSYKDKRAEWVEKRDEWRKDNGLSEVKDV